MIPPKYLKPDTWPHMFLPSSPDFFDAVGTRMHYMKCKYCPKTYVYGKEERPMEPCPVRTDKSEYARILR